MGHAGEDMWKQCARWLSECHVLHDAEKLFSEHALVTDLITKLMDGVVLCKLLCALSNGEVDPNTHEGYSENPEKSHFLKRENVSLFLELCETEFCLTKHDLFHENDLIQANNFGNVIQLLSKLSNSKRALASGFRPFPRSTDAADGSPIPAEELADEFSQVQFECGKNYVQRDDDYFEQVYDTVVSSGHRKRSSTTSPKLESCIAELVATEDSYVKSCLEILVNKYKIPLSEIMGSEELELIFQHVPELLELHTELAARLHSAMDAGKSVGGPLMDFRDRMLVIYGDYASRVPSKRNLILDTIQNDQEKARLIEQCRENSDAASRFNLTDLLPLPVQRVTRYPILLKEMIKLSDVGSSLRDELSQALESMRELVSFVNQVQHDYEAIRKIDLIQHSLLNIELPNNRKLSSYGCRHYDGELKLQYDPEAKTKNRYVFLFDRLVLICKARDKTYTFMDAYSLIEPIVPEQSLMSQQQKRNARQSLYPFSIPIFADGKMPRICFYAKSEEERVNWLAAVKTALDNLHPAGAREKGYFFEQISLPVPSYCSLCRKLIEGTFFNGYKCKETGKVAHKACLENNKLPPLVDRSRHSMVPLLSHSNGHRRRVPEQSLVSAELMRRSSHGERSGRLPSVGTIFAAPHEAELTGAAETFHVSFGDKLRVLMHDANRVKVQNLSRNGEGLLPSHYFNQSYRFMPHQLFDMDGTASLGPRRSFSPRGMFAERSSSLMLRSPNLAYESRDTFHSYFVGEMNREDANKLLEGCERGTYLLRLSLSAERHGSFTLSIMYDIPRHICINKTDTVDPRTMQPTTSYSLVETEMFPSLDALIQHYSIHSLSNIFDNIDTVLCYPYTAKPSQERVLFTVTALFDSKDDFHPELLRFRKHDKILVVSTENDDRGYWKGWLRGRESLFPRDWVTRPC